MFEFNIITFISLFISVAPPLFIARYFYLKLELPLLQKRLIYKLFVSGILITIPTLSLEFLLRQLVISLVLPLLIYELLGAFIISALCEESSKFVIVLTASFRDKKFSRIINGMVYTIIVSMGFATMENLLFLLRGGIGQAVLRTITALPLHALSAGIMGYYIGKAKFVEVRINKYKISFKGLLFVILIHGTYNFLLSTKPEYYVHAALAVYALLILILLILRSKIKAAVNSDSQMKLDELTKAQLQLEVI